MHELSIALSIVDGASEEARLHGGRVAAVHLQVGRLSGVVREALLFSFDIACEGTALEGSRLVIEDIEPTIYCRDCGGERTVRSIQEICCSDCGAWSPAIIRGRELHITALEMEDEYQTAVS